MDKNTITLYLIAGCQSIGLSLVLMLFAYLKPDSRSLKSCVVGILLLSVGLTLSGFTPALPRWMIVIGVSLILLSSGAVFYSGFAAFCEQRQPRPDWLGLGVVAVTALPFWYWGLIEPNGLYRSAVFSFAAAAINVRTALMLLRMARRQVRSVVIWMLTILFGIVSLWMAARGVLSLVAKPPSGSLRAVNPTAWSTVLGYMVLVLLMTGNVIWLELTGV